MKLPPSLIAFFLLLITACSGPGSAVAADALRAERLSTLGPFTLGGPWTGFFFQNGGGQLVRVDVTFGETPTDRGGLEVFAGEATIAQVELPGRRARRALASVQGNAAMTVDPVTGTFQFRVSSLGRDPQMLAVGVGAAIGVIDPVHHRLAGFSGGSAESFGRFFRFTRPEEASATLAAYGRFTGPGPKAPQRELLRNGRKKITLGDLFGGTSGPDLATLQRWAASMNSGDDNGEEPRQTGGLRSSSSLLIFGDEPFERAFGAPFDGLSDSEIDGFYKRIRKDFSGSNDPTERRFAGLAGYFRRSDQGAPNGLRTLHGVLALRTIRSWATDQAEKMDSGPGEPASYARSIAMKTLLGSVEGSGGGITYVVPPTERKKLLAEANRIHTREASAELARVLGHLEDLPHTQESWDQAFDLTQARAADYDLLDGPDRESIERRRRALLDSVLTTLLGPDLAARPVHGKGNVDWIPEEVAWWARLRYNHHRAWQQSGGVLGQLSHDFTRERSAALNAAIPALERTIAEAKLAELPNIESIWFSLDGDKQTAAFAAATSAAADRRKVIDSAIRGAERDALALVAQDPTRPLPFLDVRRYKAPGLLRLVYFGETRGVDIDKLAHWWGSDDLDGVVTENNAWLRFRAAFRIYHHGLYHKYFRSEDARDAWTRQEGEKWRGIQAVWRKDNPWGPPEEDPIGAPHTYVREPYAEAYIRCEASIAEIGSAMWLDSLRTKQNSASPSHRPFQDPTDTSPTPFEAAIASRDDYSELTEAFLQDHLKSHPATVRHFEHNLMALVTGGKLKPLQPLPVDGL